MKIIDLRSIIKQRNLDIKEVSIQLFPGNKHPRLALNRVISGEAFLDSNQISKLALMADLSICDLYQSGAWKARSKNGLHAFTKGDYFAELDTNTWITRIFHKQSVFHESILCAKSIPLNEYLNNIELQIEKFKKQ